MKVVAAALGADRMQRIKVLLGAYRARGFKDLTAVGAHAFEVHIS